MNTDVSQVLSFLLILKIYVYLNSLENEKRSYKKIKTPIPHLVINTLSFDVFLQFFFYMFVFFLNKVLKISE